MSRWLEHLNPEQRIAVATTEGPVLVLAGAGSGKTRVITHRIAHLIDGGVAASNILGVTFTNKAAAEMRQRLRAMVGQRATEVTLSTFHALGLMMLQQQWRNDRLRRSFTVFDTGDQLAVLKELLARQRFERSFDLGSVLGRISAFKNAFLDPNQVNDPGDDDPYAEAAALLYPGYQELLEAYAAVDFDDLVCVPTRMLEQSETCRQRWSERFRYVLVDEYQDTNVAQMRLLSALAGGHRNLCVVGDDDQAIYSWRGADVRNILNFARQFSGTKVIHLERNYRSVGHVISLANAVIAQNAERHDKQLRATRPEGPRVRLVICPDGDSELGWVARRIKQAVDEHRYRCKDIAVLYRSNILARALESELREHGLRYRVVGGTSFYDRREVKDLVAYLRICVNASDEISLRRVVNSPPRGIGPKTIARLAEYASQHRRSLHWALGHAEQALPAGDRAVGPVHGFVALVEQLRQGLRRGHDLVSGVREVIDKAELKRSIERTSPSSKAAGRRLENLEGFVAHVQRYVSRSERPRLSEYLGRISLVTSEDQGHEDGEDVVTLSTLHGAKGLEFPLVLLIGAEEGLLPHDRTVNPQANDHISGNIAEERRLCYVGITRAKDELIVSHAKKRVLRGRGKPRTLSRFLAEVPQCLFEVEDLSVPPPMEDVQAMMADLKAMLGG